MISQFLMSLTLTAARETCNGIERIALVAFRQIERDFSYTFRPRSSLKHADTLGWPGGLYLFGLSIIERDRRQRSSRRSFQSRS